MILLTVGLQVFHNGVPVELLHRLKASEVGEVWRAKPLFVEEPDRDICILWHDRLTLLHTQPNRTPAKGNA